ncbi:MAG: signal peptidase II [Opitutaceae bacterium]|jgi:signal peptidase II|nr:signal peptidase II [Opitutaceae bacterium]
MKRRPPPDLGYATDNPPPQPRLRRVAAYRNFWLVAAATLALDQLTKLAVVLALPYPALPGSRDALTLIPGFLHLAHVRNTGAAWSLFAGQTAVLSAIALATLAALYIFRHRLNARQPLTQVIAGLLVGGILGNLLDRLLRDGHVVDFVDVHLGSYIYPTFNVADSAICAAAALYILQSFLTSKRPAP